MTRGDSPGLRLPHPAFEFVLVHGGSHGAWCWERLRAELSRHGYRSHALDLPGHGQDDTPRRQVTWLSQVDAIDAFVGELDSQQIVLVGHSLAGVLIPEVARRRSSVIQQVVFLASILIDPGECALDVLEAEVREKYLEMARASADRTIRHEYEVARDRFFGSLPDAEARAFYEKTTPQPIAVYEAPGRTRVRELDIPSRYVRFSHDQAVSPERALQFASEAGIRVETMESDHDAMLSHPQELAERLIAGLP